MPKTPSRPPTTRVRTMTLRDVSAASGVSEMTVSRVLRGRGEVAAETRARVLSAARTLGYVPNRIAGSLASQRVNLVAVIVPSISNMVFPEMLEGIAEGLEGSGLQPVIGVTAYDPAREESVLYEMLSWRPSGIIIAGIGRSAPVQAMLAGAGIPVVEIMDSDGEPVDSVVGISHLRAGEALGRAVIAAGYRRIGHAGPSGARDVRAAKRLAGFEAVLAGAGIELAARVGYAGGSTLAKGRALAAELMEGFPELDFLHFANDMIGAGGLLWCLEAGYRVPERLGLAGFNGLDLLAGLPRRLATTDSCRREIGRAAAAIVCRRERGCRIELSPTFHPGDTIRRPPGEETP
jgi:LacI family gluconate utilization system Gnt-I transcriptional repressor